MSFVNIDTNILRSFVLIVDLGTFQAAASVSDRTQSALSQQMFRLEEQLGIPLFEKIGRDKNPTIEGMKIYDLAKKMLEMNDAIVQQAVISATLLSV